MSRRHDRPRAKVPQWAGVAKAPRVLIECSDMAEAWATRQILERKGYEVAECPGPEGLGRPGCVLLKDGECAALEGADVVVSLLPLSHEETGVVHRAIGLTRPALPHIVEVTQSDRDFVPEIRGNVIALHMPASRATITKAVASALAKRGGGL